MEPVQPCSRRNEHKVLDEIIDRAILAARDYYGSTLLQCALAKRKYLFDLVDCGLPFDTARPPVVRILRGGIQLDWSDRHIVLVQLYNDGTRWMMYNTSPGSVITSTSICLPEQMDAFRADFYAN